MGINNVTVDHIVVTPRWRRHESFPAVELTGVKVTVPYNVNVVEAAFPVHVHLRITEASVAHVMIIIISSKMICLVCLHIAPHPVSLVYDVLKPPTLLVVYLFDQIMNQIVRSLFTAFLLV
jgi:cytochrome c oxidase subunit IV